MALAVLLAVSIPLVAVALSGRDSGDSEGEGLRVERSQGVPEIVIYVEDPDLNEPGTAGGARQVRVECMDRDGKVIFRGSERWPFTDTDGGRFDPHAHLSVEPEALERVARCRLRGTDPPLEGRRV